MKTELVKNVLPPPPPPVVNKVIASTLTTPSNKASKHN